MYQKATQSLSADKNVVVFGITTTLVISFCYPTTLTTVAAAQPGATIVTKDSDLPCDPTILGSIAKTGVTPPTV